MPADRVEEQYLDVDGRRTRILTGGAGPVVVLLHGGWTGNSTYCGASEIWGEFLDHLLPHHRVIAVDVPGNGGSEAVGVDDLTLAGAGSVVVKVLSHLGVQSAHLVGHAEGALLALHLSTDSRLDVRSCNAVQPIPVSPNGDGIEDLTLLHPPAPLFSRASQAWTLDRLSTTPHHIDDALLDVLVAHAQGTPHREALALLDLPGAPTRTADLAEARRQSFARAREDGHPVPVSLIWAPDDPLTGTEYAVATLEYLARTAPQLSLTLIPRCGHFPFREAPRAVARAALPLISQHAAVAS